MSKWYVGCKQGSRKIFKSDTTPTKASHGALFNAVIGPFRTKRGAMIMVAFGSHNNPHIQSVSDAERIGRLNTHDTLIASMRY
jgi:hypothetical protein